MLVLGIFVDSIHSAKVNCPNGEDYSPCSCGSWSPFIIPSSLSFDNISSNVECTTGYRATLADVSNVFNRTAPSEIRGFMLYLYTQSATDSRKIIPMDLLSNHRALSIDITCSSSTDMSIIINPQAFRSSRNTTRNFMFFFCDISRLSFNFLTGFVQITSILFSTTKHVDQANWASFPTSLPSLETFSISSSTGLNEWTIFPKLSRGLSRLSLHSNEIQDAAMDRIINWTVAYSVDTLESLGIESNNLTNIPSKLQISSFPKLQYLNLDSQENGIRIIPRGSFGFAAPNYTLSADNNKIEIIEDGAFQGINSGFPIFWYLDFVFRNNCVNIFLIVLFVRIFCKCQHFTCP